MAERVTSVEAEVLVQPTSEQARITSVEAEVLVSPTSSKARISALETEALVSPTSVKARVSGLVTEVLIQNLPIEVTASDSVTFSDTATTGPYNRTAADSPSTSDSAARIGSFTRTTSDSPTTSDSVDRIGSFNRTASDNPTTSDSATVIRGVTRTAADSPATSDAATRTVTVGRTASDSPTTSDSAARIGTFTRRGSDAPTTSDAAVVSVAPSIGSPTASQQTGNSTTSNVTLPASIAAGDLIIAAIASDVGAGAHTWPSPWVKLAEQIGSASVISIGYKIAAGGETTVAVTHTSERSNHLAWRITKWHGTTPPEASSVASGNSANPNSGSLSPSWGAANTLWMSIFGADDSAAPFPVTAFPSSYTLGQGSNATATSAGDVAGAARAFNGASEDPGAYTMTGTETWDAFTIAIRPAVGPTPVSASDAVTLSDSAAGIKSLTRTASDAPSTSDSAATIKNLVRSASDAPATSDSASVATSFTRTAADAPTTSDTAARTVSLTRTASDAPTTSDAVSSIKSLQRTATGSVTFSDSASAGGNLVTVSASDSVTIADSASRAGSSLVRAGADDILTALGSSRVIVPTTPTSSPWIPTPQRYIPAGTGAGNTFGISITVDGVDITSDVEIEEAEFISMVNGQIGTCHFKVRDPNRDKSFTTGKRINLDIGGNRVWTGYLASVKRAYAFGFYSPQTRLLVCDGVDINTLFRKRFIEKLASPTTMLGPVYPAHTKDVTAIHELVTHWLDLTGDDLDVASYVENIGDINVDQKANVWQAGWDWGSAMATIARLTQAVWYIDPERHLVFTDVDSPNAPFGMSDNPTTGQVGYRELEVVHDGSGLINDALVWGVGGGSPTTVFSRVESSDSQTTHGVWQYGATYAGAWKQATVDKIANSLVYGSPLAHRGAHRDRPSVTLSTFTPGFRPAQKVDFHAQVFGYTDVLPIRRMEVHFPGGRPKYRLTLSHDIDQPFNLIDVIPITPINFDLPPFDPPPPFEPPGDCECGVTDTFDRTVVSGWGTSDSGLSWDSPYPDGSVSGGVATLPVSGNARKALPVNQVLTDVFISGSIDGAVGTDALFVVFDNDASVGFEFYQNGDVKLYADPDETDTSLGFGSDTPFNARLVVTSDSVVDLYIWQVGDPEPGTPTASVTGSNGGCLSLTTYFQIGGFGTSFNVFVTSVDIDGVDQCTSTRFDNLDRTTSNGWGTADFGTAWTTTGTASAWATTGTQGRLQTSAAGHEIAQTSSTIPPVTNESWTMTTLFQTASNFNTSGRGYSIKYSFGNGRALWTHIYPAGSGSEGLEMEGTGNFASFTFLASHQYYLSIFYDHATGEMSATVWDVADPMPSTPTLTKTNGAGDDPVSEFRINDQFIVGGQTYNHFWYWINFSTGDCPEGVPTTSSDGDPASRTCVVLTGDGSQTVFYVPGGYVAGSIDMWVGFLYQSLGIDYTETSPGEGQFTMTTAPTGDFIICYHYLTPTGGGGGRPPLLL